MTRTEIINNLIKEKGYQSYLEIGLGDGRNFRDVQCNEKIGVDPAKVLDRSGVFQMTSDEWFTDSHKFDLIFIDGLHHADQVERDIVNAWNCLNPGGAILIHDIHPKDEAMTLVPRQQKIWTGDVFRAWYGFKQKYPKIKTEYLEETWGIGLIWKSKAKIDLGFVSDIYFDEYFHNQGWQS